nr:MAG TPA: hypothetical protein [Caudoviricetes sp.]
MLFRKLLWRENSRKSSVSAGLLSCETVSNSIKSCQ